MSLIEVKGLKKSYGHVHAVRGVDLEIAQGEIFSLLGPNGAGKTTTVEILEGFRTRDAGTVSVLGFDPQTRGHESREWRNRIGIVLQSSADAGDLTVLETIDHFSGYYSNPRKVDEVINSVGLIEKEKALISLPKLSEQIMFSLKEHGKLSLSEIVKLVGANRNTVKSHLFKLIEVKQIKKEGIGKGTVYYI